MQIGNKPLTNWNKTPLRLWQRQLNFAVQCASSACRVSFKHLNDKNILPLSQFIDFRGIIMRGEFSKDFRFRCHTKLVLMLLTILPPTKNSLKFVRLWSSTSFYEIWR